MEPAPVTTHVSAPAAPDEPASASAATAAAPGTDTTAAEPRARSAAGTALLPHLYLDPQIAELEQERIFERTWQLAGHVSQLPARGSYLTARTGTQPVLVVRDDEGELRAFRNVCRHRASRLLSGSGQCTGASRCRYHGWTYQFDGTLIGVPEGRAFGERLDKGSLGLLPVRAEVMCGLVFVNLDADATPLAELVGNLPQRLERYQIPSLVPFAPFRARQPANWKVIVDNYVEGYHIPIAHPGLMRLLDYKRYEADVQGEYVWYEAPMRERPTGNRLARLYSKLVTPMPGLSEEDRHVWRYVFIYPNTTIDLYPDQINTWQINPDGIAGEQDILECYRPVRCGPRTRLTQRVNHRFNTTVLAEDIEIVDNVQQGLETRDYVCGPLSQREEAVAWFADRVRSDLGVAAEASATG
jgi:choline monooxygenase